MLCCRFVCTAAVLALYGTGRVTGIAVDCGHGVSTVAAMYDGYTVSANIFEPACHSPISGATCNAAAELGRATHDRIVSTGVY